MGCIEGFVRVTLTVLNLLFVLVSLALIAFGIALKFFAKDIIKFIGRFESLEDNAILRETLKFSDLSILADFPMLSEVGVVLMVFGSLLLAVSFCACCGACCRVKTLLFVYIILMTILVIAMATVGGLFLTKNSSLHTSIKEKLADQIHEHFDDSNKVFTLSINLMNYLLECCGVNGPSDFEEHIPRSCCQHSVLMSPENDILCPASGKPSNSSGDKPCKPTGDSFDSSEDEPCPSSDDSNDSPGDEPCPATGDSSEDKPCPTTGNSNSLDITGAYNTQGCYDKIQDAVLKVKVTAVVIFIFVLLFPVVLIIFAGLLIKEENNG